MDLGNVDIMSTLPNNQHKLQALSLNAENLRAMINRVRPIKQEISEGLDIVSASFEKKRWFIERTIESSGNFVGRKWGKSLMPLVGLEKNVYNWPAYFEAQALHEDSG